MEPEPDPATPTFAASEPRVPETAFGSLDDEHPLRRAIGRIAYPTNAERVLDAVRSDPAVDPEQARWLAGVLADDARFASADDVVSSLGRFGPPPPTTPPTL